MCYIILSITESAGRIQERIGGADYFIANSVIAHGVNRLICMGQGMMCPRVVGRTDGLDGGAETKAAKAALENMIQQLMTDIKTMITDS